MKAPDLKRILVFASLPLAFGLGLPAYADYPSTVQADAPAGYWRLNEMPVTYTDVATNYGTLGAAADGVYSAYGVVRPVTGALTSSSDAAAQFLNINNSRVNFGSPASFNYTTNNSFTLECWAKPMVVAGSSTTQRLISNGSSGQGYGFSFYGMSNLRITAFGVSDVTSDTAPIAFATNVWVHLALIRSNNMVYFFTNGVQFGAPKTLANIKTTANPLTLGRTAANGEPFTGMLDEVAFYPTNLAPADITTHYTAGKTVGGDYFAAVQANSPIGYWRLNEAPKPVSPTVVVNSGSVGAAGDGTPYGSLNAVTSMAGALAGDADTAMKFNGVDGKIDVPLSAALNPAAVSVECWARVDVWSAAHQSPVTSRESTTGVGNRGYIFYAAPLTVSGQYTNQPRWEFWTGNGSAFGVTAGPATNVVLGQWTHLVGTYDPVSGMKLLYVDGQLVGGSVGAVLAPNQTRPLRIGAGSTEGPGGFFVNGGVDEAAVFPSVLNQQRVQAHYEAAKGTGPALIAAAGIAVNPVGQTNWAPYPVMLTCVATGSIPMQLQWYQVLPDGSATNAVPGATNMALILDPTTTATSGNYYLAATNGLGGAESAWAYVHIIPPAAPVLSLDLPANIPVYAGGTAGLDVLAAGTPPITYLLQSNSVTVAVATNGFVKVPNVQAGHASADFQVVATNLFGSAPSSITKLTVLTPPVSTFAAVATGLNPAGYWRLGEDNGTIAFDYWSGRNGDYVNSYPNIPPGALVDDDDGCVQEYGAGSYARVRDASAFNYVGTTNRFTLAAWIKADALPASGTGARIFSNRLLVGATGGYGFGLWNDGSYRFTAFGVTDIAQGLPPFSVGQWCHVAAVCSNLTVYFYFNGVYQGAGNGNIGATGIKTSPYPLQLGGNPNFPVATPSDEEFFNGQIDEAVVFSRTLSAAEIKALYDARYGSLVAPIILSDPASLRIYAGGTARFSVSATGSEPLSYQWKSNGVPVTGATNTTLVVPGVTAGMNGANYSVTIANRAGTTNSANASLTILTPTAYPAAVIQDNPAALWRLGEVPASTVAYDFWGSQNGTVSGNVTFGASPALYADADTAANFDGYSPTKVEVPYSAALNTTQYSVECWARVTGGAGTYRAPVSSRNEVQGGNQGGYIIYATAANIWSFWTSTGSGWQALDGSAVVPNEWAHLVASYDGIYKNFYVNGVLVASTPQVPVPNPVRPLRIGAGRNEIDPGEYWFSGDVDEVAVYNYALSADRVAYHYGLGKYSSTTPPFIARQPAATSVLVGSAAQLSVAAGGSPVLTYQWSKDGAPIAGATQSALAFPATTYSDSGNYTVTIVNGLGTTNSEPAKLAVMPAPAFANLTNNLVLHLKFDGNYQDSSGRGNHGTAMGYPGPTLVPGKLGTQALRYETDTTNGFFSYVTLGLQPDLQFSSNVNFSVSYWVRFTGLPGDLPFLCSAINSYSNPGLSFAPSYTAGSWSYYLGTPTGNAGLYGAQLINDGTWHLLVHSFDRTGLGVTYLDGVMVDSRSIAAVGDLDNGQVLNIGQDPTGGYQESAVGEIDDLGIWRQALTAYEALSIYNAAQSGLSFDTTGPVQLSTYRTGSQVEVIWQAGTLLQSTNVAGPYLPVPGAAAPYYRTSPGGEAMFFRVKD